MYKKILPYLSIVVLFLMPVVSVYSQTKTVNGKVTDASGGLPIGGVSVTVKGTTAGTTTDANGHYSIAVPATGQQITFSFIGFASRTVDLPSGATLNISLSEASNDLNEVVVVSVGYGTLDRREVSSSITHVSAKDLLQVAGNNPLMSLQGKVAGLTISNTATGDPNSSPSIQLRGVSSRNAGLGPLYVINGVPRGNIDNINQND
ncbi:MAG: TonB-dependent receptor, partial [Pedobacter sp.]|nr:TonB-dependent receptor [Pedobacter sp.]